MVSCGWPFFDDPVVCTEIGAKLFDHLHASEDEELVNPTESLMKLPRGI